MSDTEKLFSCVQLFAIAAAAGRDENEGLVAPCKWQFQRGRWIREALQVAGIGQFAGDRRRRIQPGERFADLRQAVDPYFVVIVLNRGQRMLSRPFRYQQDWVVEHVAQDEPDMDTALLHHFVGRR